MSRTFSGLSGTYNVRANELALQRNTKSLRCLVYFLDDTQHVFEVDRRAKGEHLLDLVFRHLELIERDYFGLQFTETIAHSGQTNQRWLDPNKRLRKQLKTSRAPHLLFFKVKFYVTEPARLLEEYTRYHFFLQIRKDILSARLIAPTPALALLASYVVQSELGDFCADDHKTGYISGLKLVANQTPEFEKTVADMHRLHRGETPADAELHFLQEAKRLDMYGVELHRAKDTAGREIQIGVSGNGLLVLHSGQKVSHFSWAKIVKISFKRRHFFVQLRREGTERFDSLLGFNSCSYRTCKSLWKACVEQHTFFRLQSPKPHTKKFFFFFSLGSRFRYSGKTEFQTIEENRKRLSRADRAFVRTRTNRFTRQTVPIPHINNLMLSSRAILHNGDPKTARVQSTESPAKSAWLSLNSSSAFCPSLKSLPFIDKDSAENRLSAALSDDSSPVHLVAIHMTPDADGRFGFNVKGGHDQNCPVLVSRVAPNTPADNASPRLREGDQVMTINGSDVTGLSHEQIVQLIRSTRDSGPDAQLVLQIRPNVYARDALLPEEPAFQYIPADASPTSRPEVLDALSESMALLEEGLESGSLVLQFEQLNRKKNGESMSSARHSDNLSKNRYRDISPYDSTRVVLNDSLTGDYINASFVTMQAPQQINRYIATQGPLQETTEDFWQMVWEQKCPLVVMVTPLEEKGRKKCHKYWPEADDELSVFGALRVRLVFQSDDSATTERHFRLCDQKTSEERLVRHLQYLAWPDHGVPDKHNDFLELIFAVRRLRTEFPDHPFVVHCSAGIGRTGVLILMETALCLMEASEAIHALDLVREMREQRAMLIQTSAQFRFVCEALHRVWRERGRERLALSTVVFKD